MEKIALIAALLSGIGACVSAIATWRTVREMKRQREASYQPDVVCSPPVITQFERDGKMAVCNIGLGTAKDVKVNISVPMDELLPQFNAAFCEEGVVLHHENGTLKIETTFPDGSSSLYSLSVPCDAHIHYLFSGLANAVQVNLTGCIHALCALIMEKCRAENDARRAALLKALSFRIAVSFRDIGGQSYEREYVYRMFDAFSDNQTETYKIRFMQS